jgi:hypothetical protein
MVNCHQPLGITTKIGAFSIHKARASVSLAIYLVKFVLILSKKGEQKH